jgi:hypothetical protein
MGRTLMTSEQTPVSIPAAPKVGMVSLGCPKALVDSERILTRLRADGYQMSPDYDGADVVLVNTCGFLDSAKEESLPPSGSDCRKRPGDRDRLHGQRGRADPRGSPTSSPSPARISTRTWSMRSMPPPLRALAPMSTSSPSRRPAMSS